MCLIAQTLLWRTQVSCSEKAKLLCSYRNARFVELKRSGSFVGTARLLALRTPGFFVENPYLVVLKRPLLLVV
jgi:hypothetical protein